MREHKLNTLWLNSWGSVRFLREITSPQAAPPQRCKTRRSEFKRRNYVQRLLVDRLMIFKAGVRRTTGVFLHCSFIHIIECHSRHSRPGNSAAVRKSSERARVLSREQWDISRRCNLWPWVTLTTGRNKRAEKRPQTASIKVFLSDNRPCHSRPLRTRPYFVICAHMCDAQRQISPPCAGWSRLYVINTL